MSWILSFQKSLGEKVYMLGKKPPFILRKSECSLSSSSKPLNPNFICHVRSYMQVNKSKFFTVQLKLQQLTQNHFIHITKSSKEHLFHFVLIYIDRMFIPLTTQCYLIGAFNIVNKTNHSVTFQNTIIGFDNRIHHLQFVKWLKIQV